MQESPKPKGRGRPKGSKNKPKGYEPPTGPYSNVRMGAPEQTPKPAKVKTSAPQTFRTYTPLAKTSLGNTELYNLYGIVIDASSPHPKKNFYR